MGGIISTEISPSGGGGYGGGGGPVSNERRETVFGNLSELGAIDVGLFGLPQIGKSCLINQLLEEDNRAPEGTGGRPKTMTFLPYKHSRLPITLIDSKGVEVMSAKGQIEGLINFFAERDMNSNTKPMPLILLCISGQDTLQGVHELLYQFLSTRANVIIVITRSYDNRPCTLEAARATFIGARICRVNSRPYMCGGRSEWTVPTSGIVELTSVMKSELSAGMSIERQWKKCYKQFGVLMDNAMQRVEREAKSLALKVGFTIIPFLDQVHYKGSMIKIMEICAESFMVTISKEFVQAFAEAQYAEVKKDKDVKLCSWWKLYPFGGAIIWSINSGTKAHEFAMWFGGRFSRAIYNVLATGLPFAEDELRQQLNKSF